MYKLPRQPPPTHCGTARSPQNMRRPVMAHDFAITQSYAIFLDNPLCFDGEVGGAEERSCAVLSCAVLSCAVLYL
jgi:carotenoid cleavage dioxygenase-like enzyme